MFRRSSRRFTKDIRKPSSFKSYLNDNSYGLAVAVALGALSLIAVNSIMSSKFKQLENEIEKMKPATDEKESCSLTCIMGEFAKQEARIAKMELELDKLTNKHVLGVIKEIEV